jgi:hypothetical protein
MLIRVTSCYVMIDQVMIGYDLLCQVISGYVRLGPVTSG